VEKRQKPEQGLKRPRLIPLLVFLFSAFMLSSGMLGFLLGRNAAASTGRLIDTIVLAPETEQEETMRHCLTGQVLYRQGDPCADALVRLGGSAKDSYTDSRGKFYFVDIETGEHTLEVLDQAGNTLASTVLRLDFSRDEDVPEAEYQDSGLSFRMPEDARMLEVTLTVGEDNSLEAQEDSAYFTTRDGEVVNFSGSMLGLPSDSFAVTPAGNMLSFEGEVLLPWREVVLTPYGEETLTPDSGEALPGVVLKEDGAAETAGGVVLRPDGAVQVPSAEVIQPGDHVIAIEDDWAAEVEELPESYPEDSAAALTPAVRPSESADTESAVLSSAQEETEPSENTGKAPEDKAGLSNEAAAVPTATPIPTATPAPTETPAPTATPIPTPDPLEFRDAATGRAWVQESLVDLFRQHVQGRDLGEENGVPVIAPGSSGYYEFQLENRESYDIRYTFSVQEQSIHLPILYSVVDTRDNHYYMRREKSSLIVKKTSSEISIPAGTTQTYRIEWEWQYEDWFRPDKDNAIDTAAGTAEDRTYIVSLLIEAAQTSEPNLPDDDTRYPGEREYSVGLREKLERKGTR